MRVIEKLLSDIKPYSNNPRRNDGAVEAVAASLKEFGWQQPIVVDKDDVIIAGHTRYKAAQKLGLQTAPVVIADNLTPEQVKAYRLADNKTGELAIWDIDGLNIELEELAALDFDMEQFGFAMGNFNNIALDAPDEENGESFKVTITFNSYNEYKKYETELKEFVKGINALMAVYG